MIASDLVLPRLAVVGYEPERAAKESRLVCSPFAIRRIRRVAQGAAKLLPWQYTPFGVTSNVANFKEAWIASAIAFLYRWESVIMNGPGI